MLQQNPQLTQRVMESPAMQSILQSPDVMRSMLMRNPQVTPYRPPPPPYPPPYPPPTPLPPDASDG